MSDEKNEGLEAMSAPSSLITHHPSLDGMTPDEFRGLAKQIEDALFTAIVGQREVVRGVLTAILAGGHVLLEGAPGLGKTLLVRTLAQAVALKYSRIQFTPDLMPADVIGTSVVQE